MRRPARRIRSATLVVAAALVAGAGAAPAPPAEGQVDPRPNVLVILTDDQRPGETMGALKKTRRWLGKTGVAYGNAFVTTPLCCPSRASILTGRYAHNHGVEDNQKPYRLDQDATMQRYLHDAGYRTALVGKFLNGWEPTRNPEHFDRWSLFSPLEYAQGYRNNPFNINGRMKTVKTYSTDYLAKRARSVLRWFETDDDRPWFMLLWPFAPHGPFQPSNKYEDAKVKPWKLSPAILEKDRSDKPAYLQTKFRSLKTARNIRRNQLRMLMSVDDMVEGVRRELGRLGERERTLVVFMSDNGYVWGEHGWIDKRLPYTSSIKVPLFLRWAGHLPGGARDPRIVANIDVAATIFDATGVTPGHQVDGRSLLDAWDRDRLFFEYWYNGESTIPTWRSIRTEAYQYIETYAEVTGAVDSRE
ncbi:MAG: sulfatase family protein, partial [Actinomycetota bacterium]